MAGDLRPFLDGDTDHGHEGRIVPAGVRNLLEPVERLAPMTTAGTVPAPSPGHRQNSRTSANALFADLGR